MSRPLRWALCPLIALALAIGAAPGLDSQALAAEGEGFTSDDASGNDPREFSSKFMPYYRYVELENELEVNEFTLFGFFAFNPRFGMTYEWPIAKEVDYSDVDGFKQFKAAGGGGRGELPPIGPETGKILREGTIVYAKPGWGIANGDDSEREFTFEFGFRYFM